MASWCWSASASRIPARLRRNNNGLWHAYPPTHWLTPSILSPMPHDFEIGNVPVGRGQLFLIAGPCVIESEQHARMMADAIQRIAGDLGIPYIFKASYEQANRTSVTSFRGPGLIEGTRILKRIAEETHLPVLTDVHEPAHCAVAAEACDVLQIPAFLCRQT